MTATLAAPARAGRRGWAVLAVVVVLGIVALVAIGSTGQRSDQPLSPTSAEPDGSLALARLLAARGTQVHATDALSDAVGAGHGVLVLDPTAYSAEQLHRLAEGTTGPLVLLAPDTEQLTDLGLPLAADAGSPLGGVRPPACDDPAAAAAGPVAFEAATTYTADPASGAGATTCYGGAYAAAGRVRVLGDPSALTNRRLADTGVAALALNSLDETPDLVWLRPGADAGGPTGSIWTALPPHAGLAAVWLLVVGLLLVLWRGRRLGPPLAEPLPLVVRADEVVTGRGRLYQRSGELPRAANVLRGATITRLVHELGLPRGVPLPVLVDAVTRHLGAPPPAGLLDGPPPPDDDALLALAAGLTDLEDRVRATGRAGWRS